MKIKGSCDKVTVRVFTPAMVCVGKRELLGSQAAGWVNVDLPADFGISNGLFYYQVTAERGSVKAIKSAVGRVVVAK